MIKTNASTAYRALQYNLSKTTSTLNELYIKTSTGKKVEQASDAPSAVSTIISSRSALVFGDRYIENCRHIQDNLSNAESSINSVKDILDRAQEIAVAAANDSLSQSDLDTYTNEVTQLQESLLDLANTQVDGRYLFAGYNDQTLPFSGSPVVYNGTDDHQMISTSSGINLAKNITGNELFMDPVDVFASLDNLSAALQGGDKTLISDQLTPLNEAAEQVRSQQSSLGNSCARLDDVIAVHENSQLQVQTRLSEVEDADLTEILSEVSKMELSLEATMQVTSRVASLSLFDYL